MESNLYLIEIYASNLRETYLLMKGTASLFSKKRKKNVNIDFERLVNSSVVRKILTMLVKYIRKYDLKTIDRKEYRPAREIIAKQILDLSECE